MAVLWEISASFARLSPLQGPFVHMATILATLLGKVMVWYTGSTEVSVAVHVRTLPRVPLPPRTAVPLAHTLFAPPQNPSRKYQLLIAGAAVGVACCFVAPVGGNSRAPVLKRGWGETRLLCPSCSAANSGLVSPRGALWRGGDGHPLCRPRLLEGLLCGDVRSPDLPPAGSAQQHQR